MFAVTRRSTCTSGVADVIFLLQYLSECLRERHVEDTSVLSLRSEVAEIVLFLSLAVSRRCGDEGSYRSTNGDFR